MASCRAKRVVPFVAIRLNCELERTSGRAVNDFASQSHRRRGDDIRYTERAHTRHTQTWSSR
eukprot:883213-Prymnesium_polylepis.1